MGLELSLALDLGVSTRTLRLCHTTYGDLWEAIDLWYGFWMDLLSALLWDESERWV